MGSHNETEKKEDSIYVLQLVKGKYYVGRSSNVDVRFNQHMKGVGSEWTKLYEPIRIMYTKTCISKFDEDNEVKTLMEYYGLDNVRGGSYSMVNLSPEQKTVLTLERNHNANNCLKCGSKGHYVKDCKSACTRCGRNSHMVNNCYAKTHLNGSML